MSKYDDYTYGRTLRFFEAYYPYDTEDVHYDNVMLSMRQCKTIDELIAVRERLKEKAEKVRSYTILDKIPQNIVFVAVMALLVQIPGVVWNWIFAFLLWLAIMKSLLK